MKMPERKPLLRVLKARFDKHMHRHPSVAWTHVEARLDASPSSLRSFGAMEATGGEPDDHSGAQSCYAARVFRGWLSV